MAAEVSGGEGAGTLDETGVSPRGVPTQWRWLLPLSVGASVVAWVAGVSSGRVAGDMGLWLMVAGALFTAVAAGVPMWQQARAARSRADAMTSARLARAQMRIAIEDALDPFTALLLQMSTAGGDERTRLKGEAIQVALTTVAQLSVFNGPQGLGGSHRVRVCLFAVDPGPPRRLVPQSYAGRAGAPTTVFDDSTRAGQALLRILDDGWQIVPDTETERNTPWWDEQHAYRSYAAGPVPGPAGNPVALLTLDGLAPGELLGLDLPLMRLISHLLSLSYQF